MEDDHYQALFVKLDKDRKGKKKYCDIIITVNDVLFHAHRCVLGTYSKYFDTLFESNFAEESSTNHKLSGPIGEDISIQTVQILFQFCYTKETGLTADNVEDVLSGAEFLQIDRLKTKCVAFMKTVIITPENWFFVIRA